MKSNVTKANIFTALLLGITSTSLLYTAQSFWDLGVIIDKDPKIISQQEIDIHNLSKTLPNKAVEQNKKNIKALHSNNFIKPILKEIKRPFINDNSIIKKYDEIINNLSLKDKLLHIQKSFLKREYTKFFRIYNLIEKKNRQQPKQLDLMHIQNLYYSNRFIEAKSELEKLDTNKSDELLLYSIKTNIRLKNIEKAQIGIDVFLTIFPKSIFLPYVMHEKKLLDRKHD